MSSCLPLSGLVVMCFIAACKERPDGSATASKVSARPAAPTAAVIDSALPMDTLLARFRRDVPKAAALHSDVKSRDELVRQVVSAMARSDSAAIQRLSVNLSEYAWLYFPTTKVARPPYEVPPAFAWFQVQEKNRRGSLRALRELGGHRVLLKGYHCDIDPVVEDQNRIWSGCVVTVSRDGAPPTDLKLFGAVLERGGRFAVLSYQNDF